MNAEYIRLQPPLHRVRACACGNGPVPEVGATCECCQQGHAYRWMEGCRWRDEGLYCWWCLTPTQIDGTEGAK